MQALVTEEFASLKCTTHPFLCGKAGTDLLKSDIEKESLEGIAIAACSQRYHAKTFKFDDIITERINLREQVAWSHKPHDEDTRMLAEDCMRMGITRLQNIAQPVPYIPVELSSDIMVVGGGITGSTAAIEGARAGYKIHLIEKEKELGGWASRLHKQIPDSEPYDQLKAPEIHKLIDEIKTHKQISVYTATRIKEVSGQPGMFAVILDHDGKEEKIDVGAIVMTTGWQPYEASRLSHLGYGESPDVITQVEMEQMAKEEKIIRPSDQKQPKNILFIQCAGSRDKEHLPYCSNFCCSTSLKQARYIREQFPETNVYIIFKDIRTPGYYEQFYQEMQNDERLFLTKGDVTHVAVSEAGIDVKVENSLIGESIQISTDLVVLATGMTPNNTTELNLNYRLGKGLPSIKYDFPDSHFICFPYETRRTGIYTAGALRAPMDIASCMEDAPGAMLKAIQCIEATRRGESVHPRSGDQSFPELYMQRCTDCKRCTEECPFGSYDETEKGTPLPNPTRCRRCGICLGACPERIISFEDFNINCVSAMIKAVHIPDEFEEKPRILAFVCENDAYPAFDMAGIKKLEYSAFIRIIPVRCIGSVNKIWISDALSQGFDGIMQIGCKPGDDYQCHFIHGSELTQTRGENIQETLDKMMLEPERIRTEFLEINEYHKIPDIINDYVEEIELIGPNPFKGM